MSDNHLQQRAGLNIGIEPTLFPFVQAAAGLEIPINLTGDTLIMEHTEQAAKVPFMAGPGGFAPLGGWAWNTGPEAPLAFLFFYFVDALGNEIPTAFVNGIPAPGSMEVIFNMTAKAGGYFCLAPGEKIIARLVFP
jgi:hypothetical protein